MIPDKLQELRDQIDQIDSEIIKLLSERFQTTQKIWQIKKTNQMPKTDSKREEEKLQKIANLAQKENLDPDYAKNILQAIMEEAKKKYN